MEMDWSCAGMPPAALPRVAFRWTPDGRRKRGRPKETWRGKVEKEMKENSWTWGHLERRQPRPNKRCLSNTMCNYESSRKFGRSSGVFRYKNANLRSFFLQYPRTMSYLSEKIPSFAIPSKISRFPEEFCFSPETGLVRVVTLRVTIGHTFSKVAPLRWF